ncbi:MAG: MEDS domain-containing protein [Chloroflexi bacterium]|nr:MEDS domain-containing protein [Chloroflexota bacterium]
MIDALQGLAVHDHLCLIYETQAEQFAAIAPFVRLGLERGERCIYIADDNTTQTVLEALQGGGIDADEALRSGRLIIAGKRDAYLKQGYFDPDWMIGFLAESTRAAKAAGFSALRVTGEMTWQLGGDPSTGSGQVPGVERLIEYEAKLNRFFPEHDALAICQYNCARFSPEIILDVIRTHPLVISGGMVCRNFYYVPPDEFLKPNQPSLEAERLLGNIREREQTETALRESEERFRTMFEQSLAGIEIYDENGKLIDVNPACLEIFGVESVNAVRGFDLFADPNLPPEARSRLERGEPVRYERAFDFEVVRQRALYPTSRSGQCFLNCLITPLRASDHSITGYLVHVDDITERKRMEESLRRSEAELKEAQRVGRLGSWDWDATTDIISWSEEYYRIYGFDPTLRPPRYEEHLKAYTPESAARLDAAVKHSMQTGEGYQLDLEQACADGTRRWITARGEVKRDASGRIAGLRGTAQDITERKQAEEALHQSERNLAEAQRMAHIGSHVYDVRADRLYWSEEVLRIFGISPQDFGGVVADFLDRIHPDDRQRVEQTIEQAIATTGRGEFDHRIIRPDGSERIVHEQFEAIYEQGERVRHIGTIQDITERKRAEDELRFRNLLLSTQQEASIDGILVVDDNGKIVSFNRRFVEMWNIPPEVIESKSDQRALQSVLDMLVEPEQFIQKVGYLYERRHETSRDEIALRDERIFDRYSAPMLGPDRRYYGRVWYFRDITERKERERELQAVAVVSAALRTAPTLAEMLPVILDQALHLLRAEGAALAMRDLSSGEMVIELGRGDLTAATGLRVPPGEGISGLVIATGQPYVNQDIRSDARSYRTDLHGESRAIACVPLVVQDNVIGALWVGRQSAINPAEIRLLTAVADMAANAIHRATLHEQMERQVRRLVALHTIDSAISASLDLRLTLNVLLDNVVAQLGVDAADVLLFKPDSHMLEHAAARGFRGRAIERTRLRLGEGHAGLAALERRVTTAVDLTANATPYARASLLAEEGFASQHVAPLVVKGQIKGVLEIFHRARFDPGAEWLDFFETLAIQTAIAIDNAALFDGLQRSNIELALAYDATIEGWSHALDLRDKETEGHTRRVTELSLQLARALGVTDAERVHFRRGALLHDIGKMGVPDSILHKPGPLTEDERVIMRQHPQHAHDMLSPINYLRSALDIPYCHHEKWDGSGYPRGLKGEQIPLAARLFAVVDVWDALRSDRPYRAAWPEDKVIEYIQAASGSHFDPKVVEAFLNMRTGE